MRILITGTTGFIGARLSGILEETDHDVFRLCRDHRANLNNSIIGDVTDYHRMLEIIVSHEIDAIYHLAARSIVRNCRLDPVGCFNANVIGTVTLLEAARQSDRIQGVVVTESDKSYGRGAVPYHEDQRLDPSAIYEASKACVSHLMTAYWHGYGLPVSSIRAANCYGPGDPNKSRIVPNTICRLLTGLRPQITVGAEEFRREFIHVDDACNAYIKIMEAKQWGEAFNVGSGECYSIREVVQVICEAFGTPDIIPEEWERPATLIELSNQWMCLGKLQTIWPSYAPQTMAETLPGVIEWYRNQPH